MTDQWIVELADHQELDVTADDVVVEGGALKFSPAGATNLVVAARVWRSARTVEVEPLPPPAQPEPPRRLEVIPVYPDGPDV